MPFPDPDAVDVVNILVTFVEVHQVLLSTVRLSCLLSYRSHQNDETYQVIGKHGLLAQFGFAEPVRQALNALEGAVDVSSIALQVRLTHIIILPTGLRVRTHRLDPHARGPGHGAEEPAGCLPPAGGHSVLQQLVMCAHEGCRIPVVPICTNL